MFVLKSFKLSTSFKLHRLTNLVAACGLATAFIFVPASISSVDSLAATAEKASPVTAQQSPDIYEASLTSCIDESALPNEIEITGQAMKKAAFRILGQGIKPLPEKETIEVYCALNLV